MCGIVGLFLKTPGLEAKLGELVGPMLVSLTDRGPDSTGFAVYGKGAKGKTKLTLRGRSGEDFAKIATTLGRSLREKLKIVDHDTHAVISVPADKVDAACGKLAEIAPEVSVVSVGARMELYKEVGLPREVASRFDLSKMSGTHAIGHTRMATESAVTTNGAHPFSTGIDQCLVHNGSLSNHNALRRELRREGIEFQTDNDTEVAAGYLTWRMREGLDLEGALEACLSDLDGFFTFAVGTADGFAVLRDPIACKPAVMAETDDWVAMASEYRAIAVLPGASDATVWEPAPGKVYSWERTRV
jgi:glutamate synthase domain-containing protein 1